MIVRRSDAMGDVLAASCVVAAFVERGHKVEFQANPAWHSMLRRHPKLKRVSLAAPSGHCDINLDGAYENHPERRSKHYVQIYFERANINGPWCKPVLIADPRKQEVFLSQLARYPKPWVMICPRSNSFANRTVQNQVWAIVAKQTHGTKFWVGMNAPPPGIVDLNCRNIEDLIDYLSLADMFVTTETGPMHIGDALQIPMVVIKQATDPALTIVRHPRWTIVSADLNCLNCQQWTCPIDAERPPCQRFPIWRLSDHINKRLELICLHSAGSCAFVMA